jgi:hypothetical protein
VQLQFLIKFDGQRIHDEISRDVNLPKGLPNKSFFLPVFRGALEQHSRIIVNGKQAVGKVFTRLFPSPPNPRMNPIEGALLVPLYTRQGGRSTGGHQVKQKN